LDSLGGRGARNRILKFIIPCIQAEEEEPQQELIRSLFVMVTSLFQGKQFTTKIQGSKYG
jgi:hypothetical protein